MTDFNALPLPEQLKQLQPGDELHLRGGGWLPFVAYLHSRNYRIGSHKDRACNTLEWTQSGTYLYDVDETFGKPHILDIIRVVRPAARKVPEVVERLRNFNAFDYEFPITALAEILADHFEKETP